VDTIEPYLAAVICEDLYWTPSG